MQKIKEIFTSWRVILLILIVLGAIWTIQPNPNAEGVLITGIESNSTAHINGMNPNEIINYINDKKITTQEDYNLALSKLSKEEIVKITTDKDTYSVVADEKDSSIFLGINTKSAPTSNLKQGLDLVGGVRVILKPNQDITDQQLEDVVTLVEKRLNVYGVTDIIVRPTKDLQGNQYIIVEIAGASREEVAKLVSQQGKFEAKIGNETVFVGGADIKQVCRSADCSGIDPQRGCGQTEEAWACRFQFRVDVSPESAQKHADITSQLTVENVEGQQYLSKKLDLYLDDELVDSLYISSDLQGQVSTSFVIQGPGAGATQQEAVNNALLNMKEMQTLLITGSLPVKLSVAKMDVVSPTLGKNFFSSAVLAIVVALAAVAAVLFARYRNYKIVLPIFITGLSEVIIILGFAALIRWNLDLAAIAGILAAVGTGVDDQIVITDEAIKGEAAAHSWKERIKNAFFIIFAAYFTTVVAMLPLWAMGAGLLRGFAMTTIVGVSIGVFITRPAFAKVIEVLLK